MSHLTVLLFTNFTPLYSLLFLLILLQTEGFPRRCQLKADTSNPKKKKRHHNTICIYEAKCKTDAQKRVETSSVSDLMISFLAEHLQKKKKRKERKSWLTDFNFHTWSKDHGLDTTFLAVPMNSSPESFWTYSSLWSSKGMYTVSSVRNKQVCLVHPAFKKKTNTTNTSRLQHIIQFINSFLI